VNFSNNVFPVDNGGQIHQYSSADRRLTHSKSLKFNIISPPKEDDRKPEPVQVPADVPSRPKTTGG